MNTGISKFLNWVIVLFGILAIVSPFFMGGSGFQAVVNGFVVGIILIILGVCSAIVVSAKTARTLDIILAVLGAWLIAFPLAMGYANLSGSLLNSPILIGIVVLVLAVLAAIRNNREVARIEQAAAPAFGRGAGPAAEVQTQDTATDTNPDQASAAPAAAAVAEPQDYRGSDTTTRGGETAQEETAAQQENRRSDQDILDDVVKGLSQEKHLDASNIRVSVKDGDVVLSGYMPTVVEKHLAGEVAGKVDGVRETHNDLHVGKGVEAQLS